MSENVSETGFRWNPQRERAAELLAHDKRSDGAIAAEVGITPRQLWRWKNDPAFAERVRERAEAITAELRAKGILERVNRLEILRDVAGRLQTVIEERATSPLMANVPGGTTGLLVAKPSLTKVYLVLGASEDGEGEDLQPTRETRLTYEYAVDTGLLKELRDTAKQAAQELGEWSEKHEVGGKGGGPIGVHHSGKVDKGEFDYDAYAATFASVLAGFGPGAGRALEEAAGEPVDPGDADGQASDVPDDPVP